MEEKLTASLLFLDDNNGFTENSEKCLKTDGKNGMRRGYWMCRAIFSEIEHV